MRRLLLATALLAAVPALPDVAAGQRAGTGVPPRTGTPDGTPAIAADTLPLLRRCDGRIVSAVLVRAELPPLGGVFKRSRRLANIVRSTHVTTRDEVVRRFMVLRPGDRCTELRRTESERLLRAQPYLADAFVLARDDGMGGVVLEVTTYDELAIIAALAARTPGPEVSAVRLGNANLMGQAMYVFGEWRSDPFYRDLFAGRVTDYQFLGRPYQVTLEGARRSIGEQWLADLSHPYFTDLQRVAWRMGAGGSEEYIGFRRPAGNTASVGIARHHADIGGLLRLGVPGRLSLFGASISTEQERPQALPVTVTDTGIVGTDSLAIRALSGRYSSHRSARANFLWGVRNVRFVRAAGFDALSAPQDLRVGFQFGTLFGRSLPALGSEDDDIFLSADVYLAKGSRRSFFAVQARGEGREDGDTRRWDDVITSGRSAWYFKPTRAQTLILGAEWSAGWQTRTPFQLSLADEEGGVRGYGGSRLAGAQRAVVRAEERVRLGSLKQLADVGLAAFVDGGRLWAGDVPFGTDAKPHWGAGIGLLAAVPPRSRRLWRVDVAFPLTKDPDARMELRISSRDRTRTFYREPNDVRVARERGVPFSVFNWP